MNRSEPQRSTYDAFICYGREDKDSADQLWKRLSNLGWRVWMDTKCLIAGERWQVSIQEAIHSCQFFMVLVSSHWHGETRYYVHELQSALELWRNKPERSLFVIPIFVDDCPIPPPLAQYHCIKLFPKYEDALIQIQRLLQNACSITDQTIVGFDLGHGESAFAVTKLWSKELPQVLEINSRQSILTAVAIDEDGRVLLGDDAYECHGATTLALGFKSTKSKLGSLSDGDKIDALRIFVQEALRVLATTGRLNVDDRTVFVVGAPSGWDKLEKSKYQHILQDAGITNLELRPESRAAFLDAQELGAMPETLSGYTLIIDIGSSTTDYTIVNERKERPVDIGEELGGYLIDECIFSCMLQSTYNEAGVASYVLNHPVIAAKCLIKCRKLKETYFNRESINRGSAGSISDFQYIEELNRGFRIVVDDSLIESVLGSRLEGLKGRSWSQAFGDKLYEVKMEHGDPQLVLMTGGGSRMTFTYDLCRSTFGQEKVHVLAEPMTAIARGLALAGRTDRKITRFKREIDEYTRSASLVSIVKDQIPNLSYRVAEGFYSAIKKICISQFCQWQQGEITTLEVLQERIRYNVNEYVANEGQRLILSEVEKWLIGVGRQIDGAIRDMCVRYGIPEVAFDLGTRSRDVLIKLSEIQCMGILDNMVATVRAALVFVLTALITNILFTVIGSFGAFGPVGFVVGGMAGAAAVGITGLLTSNPERLNIPKWLRRRFHYAKFEKEIDQKRSEIQDKISDGLNQELLSTERFDDLLETVRTQLIYNADRISLMIT